MRESRAIRESITATNGKSTGIVYTVPGIPLSPEFPGIPRNSPEFPRNSQRNRYGGVMGTPYQLKYFNGYGVPEFPSLRPEIRRNPLHLLRGCPYTFVSRLLFINCSLTFVHPLTKYREDSKIIQNKTIRRVLMQFM